MLKSGWLDSYSYEASVEFLVSQALIHAEKSGPYAAYLCDVLHRRDWVALLDYELAYDYGLDPVFLVHARQALAFFEKFEPLKLPGISKTRTAFHKFVSTEASCRSVNERFCSYRMGTPMEYPWDTILVQAREKISRILGPAPQLSAMKYRFGPGAMTNVKKKYASPRIKLGVQPECSSELAPFLKKFLTELPDFCEHHAYASDEDCWYMDVDIAFGKMQFVPKDAKKFRTIIVEPSLNVMFQQGLGKAIRRRLKSRAGVDLKSQDRNRYLAYLGSLTNHLATIDFSSASDTIATQMVAFLIPDDWYVLLALARTGTVTYNGLTIKLEKFSTMGNSFTFELESLIFYSLAWACLKHLHLKVDDLSIFGDDLIIPTEAVSLVECVFAYCGFSVNTKKSFVNGPFRESCGHDYYLGFDIRPYFQKEMVSGETLFTLHNHYMRTGEVELARVLREKWIHPDLIIFGPDGYGDGHLIGDWVPVKKRVKIAWFDANLNKHEEKRLPQELGWEGSFFQSYQRVPASNDVRHFGDKLLPTYSIYVRDPQEIEEPRHSTPFQKDMWADRGHFVTSGSVGYKKVSIYTLSQGIFVP
jgi:hypothetical protein